MAPSPGCARLMLIPDSKRYKWFGWFALHDWSSPGKQFTARGTKCLTSSFPQKRKFFLNSPVFHDYGKAQPKIFCKKSADFPFICLELMTTSLTALPTSNTRKDNKKEILLLHFPKSKNKSEPWFMLLSQKLLLCIDLFKYMCKMTLLICRTWT